MENKLGDKLRELRGSLSLRDVAFEASTLGAEISHSTIANLEKGINGRGNKVFPTPAQLMILSKIYHADYNELMKLAGYIDNNELISKSPNIIAAKDSELINANQPIPVYGSIHAGEPAFADEAIIGTTAATDKIVREYGSKNLFALQINGDSMSHVLPDGFTAVFAKGLNIENGDIVAVLIDGEDATIKRFKETSLAVIFEPDSYNETYKPITFPKTGEQNFKILGKYLYASSLPI